jgi:hypothetical protein
MSQATELDKDVERVSWVQQMLDNPFLLLFIGVAVPIVSYTIWGIMEVSQIPVLK